MMKQASTYFVLPAGWRLMIEDKNGAHRIELLAESDKPRMIMITLFTEDGASGARP